MNWTEVRLNITTEILFHVALFLKSQAMPRRLRAASFTKHPANNDNKTSFSLLQQAGLSTRVILDLAMFVCSET